jgi:hypothetical protein
VLALPAKRTLERPARETMSAPLPRYEPVATPRRVFGVYIDPVALRRLGAVGAAAHVDDVALTVIGFGGAKDYAVTPFAPRTLRSGFRKPVIPAEANVELDGRVAGPRALQATLSGMQRIRAAMCPEQPSRGQAHRGPAGGFLNLDVQRDPPVAGQLRRIIKAGGG